MMARSLKAPSIGRIQKRKTNLLQTIIFGLQRAAGPYRWATSRHGTCAFKRRERPTTNGRQKEKPQLGAGGLGAGASNFGMKRNITLTPHVTSISGRGVRRRNQRAREKTKFLGEAAALLFPVSPLAS
jgi:hypothetical protein